MLSRGMGLLALTILLGMVIPQSGWAESEDLGALNQQVVQLYRQGKYTEAIQIAKRALALAEKTFGPDHPRVGTSLNNLAGLLFYGQGRHGEAEPLLERALALREKALGPDHPDVGSSLNSLAALYQAQGRYGEAEPLFQRSLRDPTKGARPRPSGSRHVA